MTASFTGMPISGTHTVVGALIGAGLVGQNSPDDIGWTKLWQILLSWFFSPTFSMILSCFLMTFVSAFTMNTKKFSYKFRLLSM
jgi:phosphate/sulfate permease